MNLNAENEFPTPFPEVNAVLQALLQDVQQILGFHFVGMYLEGSLANGDFDEDSDIDFVVVTDEEVSENVFSALYTMHERFNLLDTQWSTNLEGSYISRHALRRYDPNHVNHPNMERGFGERLKIVYHDETWNIHRYVLRERGIVIIGPDPKALIDSVSPNDLRRAVLPALHGWATKILNNPDEIVHQGYQSYTVLTLCRILYTLEFGDIVSKRKAARWIKETQGGKWSALIDQAWIGRHNPQLLASTDDINQTLDLIRYALDKEPSVF
jgi:predicted nucleotidyltransferase